MTVAAPSWVPPEQFDEYRLIRVLGRGGMGQVFLAHDTLLDRPVAVKFVAALHRSEAARQRFLIEARAAARVHHPNVVAVFRVGELGMRPYLISEFVRGQSLDKIDRPVPWPRILEIATGLARGLAAAHRRGVLHRDIKPANAVLAESGEVKLLDFGLAKLLEAEDVPEMAEVRARAATPPPITPLPAAGEDDTMAPAEPIDPLDTAIVEEAAPAPALHVVALDDTATPDVDRARRTPLTLVGTPEPDHGMTAAGALMGTPAYMSPEAWRGEPATTRSDIYSLGVLLYELCTGRPPFRGDNLLALRAAIESGEATPLAERAAIDARFAAVVDRCLRHDPALRYASGSELRDALEQLVAAPAGAPKPAGNPYRGLAAFEAEHRSLFFGRDPMIRTVADRMISDPFVLVAGDSGVGKSSLCRAGVIPRVLDGALGDRRFRVVTVLPGRRPMTALAAALAPMLGDGDRIEASVLDDPDDLARRVRSSLGDRDGLLLFVDQLEELITQADPEQADNAAALLAALAVRTPHIRVLATVRGDFLTRLARLPALAGELERAICLLAPLGRDAVREVIVGPATATGVQFESDAMVDELVAATVATGGGLPLLQFALADLWDARDKATSTITAASLAAIGGVAGALARHADSVLASMLPGPRAAARTVLLRLVTAAGTRARRSDRELIGDDAHARVAVEALVRGRLVGAHDDDGDTAYDLAHEALIAGWTTLRDWMHAEGDRRAVEERLGTAAAEWQRLGQPRDALWSRRQLDEASVYLHDQLDPTLRAFVTASRRSLRRRRLMLGVAIAAVPLLIASVYGVVRIGQQRDLDRRVRVELGQATQLHELARARNAEVEALRDAAFAAFDRNDTAAGEGDWASALGKGEEVARLYAQAAQHAETAVMIDASRSDSRDRLADILYERARIAERDHDARNVEELLARLSAYDVADQRRAGWDAPGTISVAGDCDSIKVERFYEDDTTSRWDLVHTETCSASLTLPRGSYLLTLSKPGHIDVRYPVLLGRGETVALSPSMPRSGDVPPGFVFVPGGRFLRGSVSPEQHRKGFEYASPLHTSMMTSPYFIAKYELTFGEWIAFLDSLSPDEEEKRRPRVSNPGVQGYLELRRDGTGWSLAMQPSSVGYLATANGFITYEARPSAVAQNWHRMPVGGVSRGDIEAYATWLHSTGGPEVRLCTDAEWELAARGADGRPYPHGRRLRDGDANISSSSDASWSERMGPDEVGRHPRSISVYGAEDLAGNAFELTGGPDEQAGRGGGFSFDESNAEAQSRSPIESTFRQNVVGARLCASWREHR